MSRRCPSRRPSSACTPRRAWPAPRGFRSPSTSSPTPKTRPLKGGFASSRPGGVGYAAGCSPPHTPPLPTVNRLLDLDLAARLALLIRCEVRHLALRLVQPLADLFGQAAVGRGRGRRQKLRVGDTCLLHHNLGLLSLA